MSDEKEVTKEELVRVVRALVCSLDAICVINKVSTEDLAAFSMADEVMRRYKKQEE